MACGQASKFQTECTCSSGKWIVKSTCPNVPFTCLKYIKPMPLMWKSEMHSRPSGKSCRYSTGLTVIFTCLRQSDNWNFEPWWCHIFLSTLFQVMACCPFVCKAINWFHFVRLSDSVRPSICPFDRIVSTLNLPQYLLDPFRIYTA